MLLFVTYLKKILSILFSLSLYYFSWSNLIKNKSKFHSWKKNPYLLNLYRWLGSDASLQGEPPGSTTFKNHLKSSRGLGNCGTTNFLISQKHIAVRLARISRHFNAVTQTDITATLFSSLFGFIRNMWFSEDAISIRMLPVNAHLWLKSVSVKFAAKI